MKKYLLLLLSGALMTSCIDTIVLPNDVIIGEDYWKSKDDVTGMIAGAYIDLASADAVERYVVWGDFRSDDIVPFSSSTTVTKITDLQKLHNGNVDNTNTYTSWLSLYTVINKCNIVLERAPQVVSLDPAYTQETWYADQAQVVALRSLCYFYLVRAFRDVPYTTTAYLNSSQERSIPQLAPLTVLGNCINDLEEVLPHALSATAYTDWRKWGYINKDAINALLADMYLWRASVTHNTSDYQKCVDYCDAVITSKQQQNSSEVEEGPAGPGGQGGASTSSDNEYNLIEGYQAYNMIFNQQLNGGNSKESIFELQMEGSNNSNAGIRNCYWNYDASTRTNGLMKAASIFSNTEVREGTPQGIFLNKDNDFRYIDAVKGQTEEMSSYDIRKMASVSSITGRTATAVGTADASGNATGRTNQVNNIAQNWIFYRLTDVMLMKAEALVQLASQDAENLTKAFELVDAVYTRSQANGVGLTATDYTTQEAMELLVLQERHRELCFEGKRWFDLLRYNYRHVESQPDKTMAEISGGSGTNNFPSNYENMMELMKRKYTEGGEAISSKMAKEPTLYMPISESEMLVNSELVQNPAYNKSDSYTKY